ncbi:MAG: 6,7-dimethyl-8-ribityllumazine synthase, partial [Bacteroidia bacterium]|nr:6,7-dimethyl-8-ribityllumazine synthase [Bacteroidia bacterium]
MATVLKNLANYSVAEIPDASDMKFGIIVAQWNNNIT